MRILATLIFTFLFVFSGQSQIKLSVEGKDFWFSIMPNFGSNSGSNSHASDSVLLTISGKQSTSGVVENVTLGYSVPFTVNALSVTEIRIPNDMVATLSTGTVESTAIHIYSEDTITAFVANMQNATRDATNLIPTQALGKEYMVTAYAAENIGLSQFIVVATEDSMNIKITPTANTAGGQTAGIPFDITLNRGEVYLVQGDSVGLDFDLTGTTISSLDSGTNCSNFAVFAGSSCTNIPSFCTACDQVFSILPPIAAWGKEYLLAPFQIDSLSTYRITALNDNSDIYIDGNFTVTLNSGEHLEVNHDSSARCITSDSLISVTQFMQGKNCSTDGDPAMLVINSVSQGVTGAIFTTIDVLGTADTNFATIITHHDGIGVVLFDGNPVDSNTFIQFQECSEYYYAYISLPIGAHTVTSDERFSLYIYGMTGFDSYAYSAGSTVFVKGQFKEETCSYSKTTFTGDSLLVGYWWYRLDDPQDTLSTDLNLTLTSPIAPGIYLFSGYSSVSGCKEDVYYKVTEPSLGVGVQILADPEFVCAGEEVDLSFIQRRAAFDYNFEDSSFVSEFSLIENVEIASGCGSIGSNSLTFNGDQVRVVSSQDIDATLGGFVEFFASVADGTCDPPDIDDYLFIDYSTNGGGAWTNIDSLDPTEYQAFKRFRATIPTGAQTISTRFRIIQSGSYSANEDVWLVDEFGAYVEASSITDSLRWTPTLMVDDSTAISPIGYPEDTTVFSVYFRDSAGCVYSDSIAVTAPEPLNEPVDFDTLKCNNTPINFTALEGGGTYEWTPASGVSDPNAQSVLLTATEKTDYQIKIVDPWGCDSTIQRVSIDVKFPPSVPNFRDTLVCDGGVIQYVINDSSANITWSDNSVSESFSITQSGTYFYHAENECGVSSDSISVVTAKSPEVEVGADLLLCPHQPLTITLNDDGNAFFWSNGDAGVSTEFLSAGTFTVTVTNPDGCASSDSLRVYDDCESLIKFPNVFTPNGDGVNDLFVIEANNVQKVEVTVYNRWGQRVFYAARPDFYWDGTIYGTPASEGIYYLFLEVLTADGRDINHKGSLSLIRD
ncbi:MAG: gliding motility-associated C-terminal domain-containing protein [Flavobacteriales bacterium]|nr:gliding motility-associated C-terminal domain-containing protein [Flavobacteriales bacterium]